jgi:hypothetical protein
MTDILATILAEIRSLHAKVDALRPPTPHDVVRTIAATEGDSDFTSAELVAASVNTPLERHLSGMSVRSVGKLLGSLEGHNHGGVIIRRLANCRAGILWRCEFAYETR